MSWQGQVNKPIGVAGIDSNGKIHALDGSQIFNLNASSIASGNLPIANLPNGGVNGVSQLVQLDASGNLPSLNASALTNLSAANLSGTIPSANLPEATTSTVGVVQVGSNIDVAAGVISVPAATNSAIGLIQPDGVTITVVGGLLVASGATSAANITGGSAGDILYQTAANTTGFLGAANGVLVGNGGTPTYTTTPTLTGTNFSGIPNSATTATSANTASAIVARDSNGDFTARNVTVTGSLIGSASSYNSFDPTIITGSSTLGTNVSMIIATGSGGYSTELPEASTFPVSQLGKPIYYINNSSAANSVGVETGGYTSVTLSITGGTTNPPLYALDASSLPTVSSMTVAANVATATANNASAQTFDYVTMNNIIQVTPTMKFTSGNVLTVDPTSTIGNLKLTGRVVTVGQQLLVDDGTTVAPITVSAVTTITSVENFSITGSTDTPPTYAFNAIRVPTVVNGTVVGNTFVANANNASAATLDYSPGGSVSAITPKMTFTNGNVLSVDPSSTIGSLKLNSATSGLLTNGDKLIIDDGSSISQTSGITVSQSTISIFSAAWGIINPFELNGKLIYCGQSNKRIAASIDGSNWVDCGVTPYPVVSMCYFNGLYWIGVNSGTIGTANIYSSPDLTNWTLKQTLSLGRVQTSLVATNGIIICAGYSGTNTDGNAANNKYYIYSSLDGITFTQQLDKTTGNTSSADGGAELRQFGYANGEFTICNYLNSISRSTDGVIWESVDNPAGTNRYLAGITKAANRYCLNSGLTSIGSGDISISTNFTSWSSAVTGLNYGSYNFIQSGNTVLALANDPLTVRYSTDGGVTWNTGASMTSGGVFGVYSSILQKYVARVNSLNATIQTTTSPTVAWGNVNLSTLSTYQYTITSPSLLVALPSFVAKGGEQLQYSVSATSTPSFSTATLTYTRSGDVITATYAQATGTSGVHVQLKAATLNSGDILSQIGADLTYQTGTEYVVTSPSLSVAVPIWVALGGQTEEYSVSPTSTPSFTAATSPAYTRSTNDITVTYAAATPVAYPHLQLKASGFNSGDILTQIGADLHVDVDMNVTVPAGGKYALIPTSTAGWQSFQFAD